MTLDGTGLEASNPHAPQITSDGGAGTAMLTVAENVTLATTVTALDPDPGSVVSYAISGGADAGRFTIDAATGVLRFAVPPDFEAPGDADHDNSYLVEVRASDGSWSDTQALTVNVIDASEAPDLIWLTGTSGDDSFTAPAGNARIDGLGGVDTVTFNFKLTEAAVTYRGSQVIIDSAGSHTVLTGFERYVFADGTVDNVDGDRMVDDLFYYSQYHDVWSAGVDAGEHYQAFGWHEGRDPSAFFSTSLYLSLNPDVRAAGVDPLAHFDAIGWKEGRAPSISFDPAAYLAANPDVARAAVDPLLHFLMFGGQEGRQPSAFPTLLAANGFDYVHYLQHNPDVAAARVDPLAHFEVFGWREGRNPNALFDTAGYLAAYADVAAGGVNPFDHYSQFGWNEGRDPSVQFDTAQYLAHYTDVAAAHVNPLVHALHFGLSEGRSPFGDGAWG
jgi:serralysin